MVVVSGCNYMLKLGVVPFFSSFLHKRLVIKLEITAQL